MGRLLEAKKHIVDKILTVSCPRCGQAYDNFNGCCALTCSRKGCGCNFCAYCLGECGNDAHHHVAHCRLGYGLFPSQADLQQAYTDRRRRMVTQYLMQNGFEGGDARRRLLELCRREFDDLGLKVD